jgi:hypothetical protein
LGCHENLRPPRAGYPISRDQPPDRFQLYHNRSAYANCRICSGPLVCAAGMAFRP